MKYIDTTGQNIDQTIGEWLHNESSLKVQEFHFQVGYFSAAGLRPISEILRRVKIGKASIKAAIGSNDRSTGAEDIKTLLSITGPLTGKSSLSIVSFEAGLFHPKVYAIKRKDGTKAIYLGSSNLTGPALGGLNVESGIILDDRDGDDTSIYTTIISNIEKWSNCNIPGANPANSEQEVESLLKRGILRNKSISQPGLSNGVSSKKSGTHSGVRRKPLKSWSKLPEEQSQITSVVSPTPSKTTSQKSISSITTQDTLVAEISGPGRWQQATFPKDMFPSFFGVPAGSGLTINLTYTDGVVRQTDNPAARTKSSSNFTFELSSQKGISYPSAGRPIAIFHRSAPGTFIYTITMPGQSGYTALSNLLSSEYTGPQSQIMRVTTDLATVKSWWPNAPIP